MFSARQTRLLPVYWLFDRISIFQLDELVAHVYFPGRRNPSAIEAPNLKGANQDLENNLRPSTSQKEFGEMFYLVITVDLQWLEH